MERIKVKPRRKSSKFFTGPEVENTYLHHMPTLFVVGEAEFNEVRKQLEELEVQHVFLGARQSATDQNVLSLMDLAEEIIEGMEPPTWVTLDFDFRLLSVVRAHSAFGLWRFVPLVSLKIPNVTQLPSLTSFKIDDRFRGNNGGVWTLQLRDLLRVEHAYTPWKAYENDKEV